MLVKSCQNPWISLIRWLPALDKGRRKKGSRGLCLILPLIFREPSNFAEKQSQNSRGVFGRPETDPTGRFGSDTPAFLRWASAEVKAGASFTPSPTKITRLPEPQGVQSSMGRAQWVLPGVLGGAARSKAPTSLRNQTKPDQKNRNCRGDCQ